MRNAVVLSVLWANIMAASITRPKFLARSDYSPGGFVIVADVNGDQIPDVISLEGHTIFTLLGNGNGTFRAGPSTQPGHNLYTINGVAIDLNGDGKVDLVLSGTPNNGVGISVCFGNGDGTFQPPVSYAAGTDRYNGYVVVGDFNGDGIPDAAIPAATGIWLFTGKGSGAFNRGVLTPVSGSESIASAAAVAADFNIDGKLDLAIAYGPYGGPYGFILVLGHGDGTFQAPILYNAPSRPGWLATSDLNADGLPDLLVGAGPLLYLNNGSGGFAAPSSINLPGGAVGIGDVNGDIIPDLVSSGGYVALGLGNGQFAAPIYYPVESSSNTVNAVVAHLRKINVMDIVTGENAGISVLLNEGKGTFVDGLWLSMSGIGNCGATADYNRDGKPDLAVVSSQGVTILLGTGNTKAPYTPGASISLSGMGCPITGDLNGDGISDLVVGANSLGGVGAYLGNGDGTFRLASVVPLSPGVLILGDFNHDGKLDIADSSNQIALGNGGGTFQAPVPILTSPPPLGFSWIAAGDVNNDGWPDLLATQSSYGLYVMVNDQHGGFTLETFTNSVYPAAVMVADLNLDGNLDAVVMGGESAYVYLGDGQGGFTFLNNPTLYPGPDVVPFQIRDVNGDGKPDLLLPADGSLGIALGRGDGTFLIPFEVGAAPGVGQVFTQNLHGQSPSADLPDIVAPCSGGVMVLYNLTK